jgi:hypothetical protein
VRSSRGAIALCRRSGTRNLGQVFQAKDQTRAEDVRIIVLHQSLALNGEVLACLGAHGREARRATARECCSD